MFVASGGRSDISLLAGGTDHPPGKEIAAAVGGPAGVFTSPRLDDLLCPVEQAGVFQDRLVVIRRAVPYAPVVDLPQVGAVAQDDHDALPAPPFPALGPQPAPIEFGSQCPGSQALLDVHPEDHGYELRLFVNRHEFAGGPVQLVAEGAITATPLPSGGLALHAVDDAVDDGFAFELSEDSEHLDQHAPDRCRGVEWLRGRPEGGAPGIEPVQDLDQAPEGAGKPVHPVDQQNIEAPAVLSRDVGDG
ncbi:hypothetical protein OIE63_26475 [Streptomyces sp. NBC_01795]|nr:hypothetical protein [Streptomyces sp. NBC_01795]WSA94716.1 hypothetical protein OIE63_26475 [Streptomyces sp. NBC_01795]